MSITAIFSLQTALYNTHYQRHTIRKKTTIQAAISFAGYEKQVAIQELEKPDLDQKNTDDEGISLIYEEEMS